jgi:hypothetical protein
MYDQVLLSRCHISLTSFCMSPDCRLPSARLRAVSPASDSFVLYGDERDSDERKRLGVNVLPSFFANARSEYSWLFDVQLSSRLPHVCSVVASLAVAPVLAGHFLSMYRASSPSTTMRGMTSWHQRDQGIQVDVCQPIRVLALLAWKRCTGLPRHVTFSFSPGIGTIASDGA